MADELNVPSLEGIGARRAAVVTCWLCGTHLHENQMISDGDSASQDIRWYCKDTRGCTERWTSSSRRLAGEGAA